MGQVCVKISKVEDSDKPPYRISWLNYNSYFDTGKDLLAALAYRIINGEYRIEELNLQNEIPYSERELKKTVETMVEGHNLAVKHRK